MLRDADDRSNTGGMTRRTFLGVAAASPLVYELGATPLSDRPIRDRQEIQTLRWGVVGTGSIANAMAGPI